VNKDVHMIYILYHTEHDLLAIANVLVCVLHNIVITTVVAISTR